MRQIFLPSYKRGNRLVKVREFSRRQSWKERPCIRAQGCVTWVGALCTVQSEESGVEDRGAWRCAGITTCCTPAISGTRASIHTRDWVPASGPPGTHSSLSAGNGQTEAWRGKDVSQTLLFHGTSSLSLVFWTIHVNITHHSMTLHQCSMIRWGVPGEAILSPENHSL